MASPTISPSKSPGIDMTPIMPAFAAHQTEIYRITYTTLNWVSLALAFLQVLIFILVQRSFPQSIPLYYGLSTFFKIALQITSQIVDFQTKNYPTLCLIQAIGAQYLGWANVCWFFVLALHLYLVFVEKFNANKIKRLHVFAHLFCWGLPLLTTIPPIALKHYGPRGPNGEWCWISGEDKGMWSFGFFYIPVGIILLVICFFWVKVAHGALSVSSQFKTRVFLFHRMAAVLVMLVIYGWQMTHRIATLGGKHMGFFWEMVHMISTSVWGIYMFFAFGLTYDNIQLLLAFWHKNILGRRGIENELQSPVVVPRPKNLSQRELLMSTSEEDERLYSTSPTRPPWLRSHHDALTPATSPLGSLLSSSTSTSGRGAFSFSGTDLTGYAPGKVSDDSD